MVRAEADSTVLRAGGIPEGTIVAGGRQACDPHERGHGRLRAHELIILDIFPRDAHTGFFGDLTRTVVRGRANEAQRQLWETVCAAQRMAIRAIKPRAKGAAVHKAVQEFFVARGYPTERRDGRWTGFFHGTGHGLGLDLHEEPRLGVTTFRPGQVFTVEPGLYYPEIGGARHEDVVTVTASGCRLLSRLRVPLEL
jgi:Xaa-Pro aminopeptidase